MLVAVKQIMPQQEVILGGAVRLSARVSKGEGGIPRSMAAGQPDTCLHNLLGAAALLDVKICAVVWQLSAQLQTLQQVLM